MPIHTGGVRVARFGERLKTRIVILARLVSVIGTIVIAFYFGGFRTGVRGGLSRLDGFGLSGPFGFDIRFVPYAATG